MVTRRFVVATLISAVIVASATSGFWTPLAHATNPGGAEVGFWASQTLTPCAVSADPSYCPRDLSSYTPDVWHALAATHGVLYLNLVYTSDFGSPPPGRSLRTDGIALVRHANRLGVPVVAWITAPLSGGIFANENNAALMDDAVRAFQRWRTQQHLRMREVSLDLELPAGYEAVVDAMAGNPAGLMALARVNIDPIHQCRAMNDYRRTIAWAHSHGVRITATPTSLSMDDLADGHLALADVLDLAPFPPTGYDAIYVQAYRSYSMPGPGYVAAYFDDAKRYVGVKGEVSIGGTGNPPYNELANLVSDVRMLVGLGAKAIPIFDFDGTVRTFGAPGLRAVIEAGRHPLRGAALAAARQEDVSTRMNRDFFHTVDAAASALTVAVTTSQGHPQQPNAYPTGCAAAALGAAPPEMTIYDAQPA